MSKISKENQAISEYIHDKIDTCKLKQNEIAEMLGYDNPNVITMFKQGRTKLPVYIIPKLAKIIEVDPAIMLDKVMSVYEPEKYDAIKEILGDPISEDERDIINALRKIYSPVQILGKKKEIIEAIKNTNQQ